MSAAPTLRERYQAALNQAVRRWQQLGALGREHATENRIHRLRVETRRLLAALDLVADSIPRHRRRRLRADLKSALRALGPLRDAQVQRRKLGAWVRGHSEYRVPYAKLRRQERRLSREALAALSDVHFGKLGRRISRLLPEKSTDLVHDARFRQALVDATGRARERLDRRWPRTTADHAAFHRARVALKRYRYQLEVVATLNGSRPLRGLAQLRALQKQLGNLHDCELMLDLLDRDLLQKGIPKKRQRLLRASLQRRMVRLRRACLVAPPVVSGGGS